MRAGVNLAHLPWYRHGTALALTWHCLGTALALPWHHPGAPLQQYWSWGQCVQGGVVLGQHYLQRADVILAHPPELHVVVWVLQVLERLEGLAVLGQY